MIFIELEQIPEISIQILEDGYCAVGFRFRLSHELDSVCNHVVVVSPEIVSVEEKKDPATRLSANEGLLFGF